MFEPQNYFITVIITKQESVLGYICILLWHINIYRNMTFNLL